MCLNYQLPSGFKDRRWSQTLPVGDIKRTIHLRELSIALGNESGLLLLLGHRYGLSVAGLRR